MSTTPRDKRVRLSLECSASTKASLVAHGKDLGQWSLVGAIRRAISRSAALLALERRGTLKLVRKDDGVTEDVEIS